MELFRSYYAVIAISLIIIVSYFFNVIAKKTNVPSVLLLIGLGIGLSQAIVAFNMEEVNLFPILEVLGIVGLIMILLEGALDLELKKEKAKLILQSLFVSLTGIVGCSAAIAFVLNYFLIDDFYTALIYAVPLSIISSAIIIPSVANLPDKKREFMLYDSTFSDIIGIIAFTVMVEVGTASEGVENVALQQVASLLLSVVLAFVLSYVLVWLFQKIKTNVKLFLLIAVILLLYSVGELLHLSALIIVLVFGLVLNNHRIFFRGFLKRLIEPDQVKGVYESFHTLTMETAFVVRTFFFVIFGMTIVLSSLLSSEVALIALAVAGAAYLIRLIALKLFVWNGFKTLIFIAPRGLITILLFFNIPAEMQVAAFEPGILLYVILITSVVMSVALITSKKEKPQPEHSASEEGHVVVPYQAEGPEEPTS